MHAVGNQFAGDQRGGERRAHDSRFAVREGPHGVKNVRRMPCAQVNGGRGLGIGGVGVSY